MTIKKNVTREADVARAREMANAIMAFYRQCSISKETDTGDAWALLLEARRVLLRFAK